jgi:hypothetical protein
LPIPKECQIYLFLKSYLKFIKPPIIPIPIQVNGEKKKNIDGNIINPICGWARIATWSAKQNVSISQD